MLHSIKIIFRIVNQIGFFRVLQIAYIYYFEPFHMKFLKFFNKIIINIKRFQKKITARKELARWKLRKSEIIQSNANFVRIEEIGLTEDGLNSVREKLKTTKQIVLASIDQDGYFLSYFGHINGLPCVSEEKFMPRKRFSINLIAIDGVVGVKKGYNGCASSFLRELEALNSLHKNGCNVPAILDLDFDNLSMTISYIPGAILREELALKGALVRDRDVNNNPEFTSLSSEARKQKRISEGKKYLYDVISQHFVENIYKQISKIHSIGFLINDIKYGNVVIGKNSGNPFLLDFESSDNVSVFGHRTFRLLIDNDIEQFNLHFGMNKLTYQMCEKIIYNKKYPFPNKWYAPSYFGYGLRIGSLWNPEVGWGRWHYILKNNLPNLDGKRILDLGANNGFISLQLLRCGASEVFGFEIDPDAIEQGMFVKSMFEWSDNRTYQFRYIQSSMIDLISMDLGKFDLVIALCSIYYLDDNEITELIGHISNITDCFIVQANIADDIGRSNQHTTEKASVNYLKIALQKNGFQNVKIIAPKNYNRPLLIGRKEKQQY